MYKMIGKLNRGVERIDEHRFMMNLNENVFSVNPGDFNTMEFTADTLLDDESWFFIDNFLERDFCLEILKQPLSIADYNELKRNEVNKLHYIIVESNNYIYIQKVTPSLIMKNKMFLIGDSYRVIDNEQVLLFKNNPDAVYDKEKNKLYFKKISTLNSIFPGIEEMFRDATDEEVNQFVNLGFIDLEENFKTENIKSSNRKRILMLNDILRDLESEKLQQLLDYTNQYCPDIPYTTKSFKISNEKELKDLLYGLQERYYTTIVGGEDRLANSIILMQRN